MTQGEDKQTDNVAGQLTVRGVLIGCIGCVIITAASIYTALKMGALPWPIVFAALVALFFLRLCGSRSLNEANVTHTIMSAGAMVAGGLAFTIPGIWILGLGEVSLEEMLVIALAGTLLGLVASAYLRPLFIDRQQLEFPIGRAAAETLKAGDAGGSVGVKLFCSMGLAGLWAVLRDAVAAIPAMVLNKLPFLASSGVTFGIYLSPMMLSVGYLVGSFAMIAWFVGALWQLVFVAGSGLTGLLETGTAQAINSSLGMGVMMGCGLAVICKDVLPQAISGQLAKTRDTSADTAADTATDTSADASADTTAYTAADTATDADTAADAAHLSDAATDTATDTLADTTAYTAADAAHLSDAETIIPDSAPINNRTRVKNGMLALGIAALAYVGCVLVGIGPAASVLVVLFAFVAVSMSAQSVGQTGIDPMEIFGLIVLLVVALLGDTPQVQLFFVAAIIAVACGLGGDVMNDFKAGALLGTNPRAQVLGQAIGGIVGAVVAAVSLYALVGAYGPDAFGLGKDFVSAQASVVATLVAGVPSVPGFVVGLAIGFVLYFLRLPSMMIGLGIYLPFYMSLTGFLGCVLKWIIDAIIRNKNKALSAEELARKEEAAAQTGTIIASGVLGGESIVGVILALLAVFSG